MQINPLVAGRLIRFLTRLGCFDRVVYVADSSPPRFPMGSHLPDALPYCRWCGSQTHLEDCLWVEGQSLLATLQSDGQAFGSEIRQFWDYGIADGFWVDDEVIPVFDNTGQWVLPDEGLFRLDQFGWVCSHNSPPVPFRDAFLRWKSR